MKAAWRDRAASSGLAILLAAAASCSARKSEVVYASEPPAWGTSLRLVEEVRIGALSGAEEYSFGRVGDVAVGADSAIYVADTQIPLIRVYNARGAFVRNVGQKGAGPGEYQSLTGLRSLADGRLAVWDSKLGRFTVFNAAGTVAASYTVDGLHGSRMQLDRDGNLYVLETSRPTTPGGLDWTEAWTRVSPAGKVMETIPLPAEPNRRASFQIATPSGSERPFVRESVSTMSTLGYLIRGANATYAFEAHPRRAPAVRIERAFTPVKLQADELADWNAWARRAEETLAHPAGSNSRPQHLSFEIPPTKPAVRELQTDSQGRVWVRPYIEAELHDLPERRPGDNRPRKMWREQPTFDVFEPDGRLLGRVVLPWDASLQDARDRQVWATVRGEDGEEYVVRFRIELGEASAK